MVMMVDLQPIYFFGWVIQPLSITGQCQAYERLDTRKDISKDFGSILEAKEFILKKLR